MSDLIVEAGQEQLKASFAAEVNKYARELEPALGPQLDRLSQNLPAYRKSSASVIYGRVPWSNAVGKYEDGFGFYQAVTQKLKEKPLKLHPDDARDMLVSLDELGKRFGVRISLAKPGDKEDAVTYEVDGQKFELCDPRIAHGAAMHIDNSVKEYARIRGVDFEIAQRSGDYGCNLLISEDTIDKAPFAALLFGLHEAGHADEIANGLISSYEDRRHRQKTGVACTERSSTLLPLKVVQAEYLRRGGDEDLIKYAAPQALLYNRVVMGQS